jgi:A/G-specific adenine glycosylase
LVSRIERRLTPGEIASLRRRLLAWGRRNYRSFPWRETADHWLGLVAEVLLQRTQASQVIPAFEYVRSRFPTAQALYEAGPAASLAITDGLGLHKRGAILYKMAETVAARASSEPLGREDLERITGLGDYTINAWLSLHRSVRATIVDANIARWLCRYLGRPPVRDVRDVAWPSQLLEQMTPRRSYRDFNYALLDFTMTVCRQRTPDCDRCPFRSGCSYWQRAHHGSEKGTVERRRRVQLVA